MKIRIGKKAIRWIGGSIIGTAGLGGMLASIASMEDSTPRMVYANRDGLDDVVIRTRNFGSSLQDDGGQYIFIKKPDGAYLRLDEYANALNWKNEKSGKDVRQEVSDITDYVNKTLEGK